MLEFTKIQGNGNDFIVIDNREGSMTSPDLSRLAASICERRQSVGADGLLVVEMSERENFTMRLFNNDGSEGEMCGNGARCIARYAWEKKIAGEKMSFETLAGPIHGVVTAPFVELDMGETNLSQVFWGQSLKVEGETFPFVYLVVGVPHCVLFVDNLEDFSHDSLRDIGRTVRYDTHRFPKGTNVNFVQRSGERTLKVVTYERGVEDLTLSCGTGSTASAIAASIVWEMAAPIQVQNPGGDNWVTVSFDETRSICKTYLTGKTVMIAEGRLYDEALPKDIE
ncbi:MAG: diaminopimelate epimerase [Aminobacterium colombiense]|uniref:diaminopimelate epimerase n=1 Tax=Aminobacterium sp. EBM-42 TaxID=1918503 RepID=UPI00257B7FE8|nr:diaminopimelate epimerase [Aminobacterium sp. EBM-42]MDD3767395.1 diaminopimelate epimerase [Aminobacterium colombiense]MDD4265409.1 diaminopimelate epimerase [Aminobacterium colombiense]